MKTTHIFFIVGILCITAAQGITTVSVQPSSVQGYVGESFAVNVTATYTVDAFAYQFELVFNNTILNATSVSEGDFLNKSEGTQPIINITNTAGKVTFSNTRWGGIDTGINNAGVLANVTFKAIANGTTSLALQNVYILNSKLPPEQIELNTANGTVTIGANETETTFNASLSPGWQLMSLPSNTSLSAESFLNQSNCTLIARYDNGIQTHIKGTQFFDFDMRSAVGYYTYCPFTQSENVTINARQVNNTVFQLTAGWNLIGSVPDTITNATQLRTRIGPECISAAKYESRFMTSEIEDFAVTSDKGYFVYMIGSANWTI